MQIKSQFKVLLAEKEIRDGRNYTLKDVAVLTRASIYVITGLANNTLREYPRAALEGVCYWLGCSVGDLLTIAPSSIQNDSARHEEYNHQDSKDPRSRAAA